MVDVIRRKRITSTRGESEMATEMIEMFFMLERVGGLIRKGKVINGIQNISEYT